jgi:malate dehydrogenase (oxaloacetate-decarboxylating)(NADP+)
MLTINERPDSEERLSVRKQRLLPRRMGQRNASRSCLIQRLSNPSGQWLSNIGDAVAILDRDGCDFE